MKHTVFLVLLIGLLGACTSARPGPRKAPDDDRWKDYGLGGPTADRGTDPERDQPIPMESRTAPDVESPPRNPVDDLPRIDPSRPTTGQMGTRFDQQLDITLDSGTRSIFSTIEMLGGLVRQDDFSDDTRGQAQVSSIQRDGGILRLDHSARKTSFSVSVFDVLNDPSVVFFFQELKAKSKWKLSRTAIYEGVECDVYKKPAPKHLNQTDILWVAKEPAGFLLRYSSKNLLGIETLITRTRPAPAELSADRFQAPKGYTPQ